MKQRKIQNSSSPLNRYYFRKKAPSDVWPSSKYVSDKLSFGSYSEVNVFFQIAIFPFFAVNITYVT